MSRHFLSSAAFVLVSTASLFAHDVYTADKAHSTANFRVKHLVSHVNGRFNDFDATVNIDPAQLTSSSVELNIRTASINTDNETRDKHLRSADFFDAEKFPTITFKSTKITATGKEKYNVTGNLTMHGVTKTITLPVEFGGFAKDPWGNQRAGFSVATTLNRKDYNILWNKSLDEGGYLLGDDVDVSFELETVKQKPAAAVAPVKK